MRKRVYFVHGFDPRGSNSYYRFFQRHKPDGINFSQLNGNKFIINNDIDFVILEWYDVVSKYWYSGPLLILYSIIGYSKFIIKSPIIYRNSRMFFVTCVYPLFSALFLFIIVSLLFYVNLYAGLISAIAIYFLLPKISVGIPWLSRYVIYYLSSGKQDHMIQLSKHFAKSILETETSDPASEILIIAHSEGACYVISAIAQVINSLDKMDNKINLVSLGSCMPLNLLIPEYQSKMNESFHIVANSQVCWYDLTAATDWICIPKVDMYQKIGISASNLFMHNLPFSILFEKWKKLQWQQLYVHFAYFVQYDNAYKYNFFAMLTSPNSREYLGELTNATS